VFPEVLRFLGDQPNVDLLLFPMNTSELQHALVEGRIQAAFARSSICRLLGRSGRFWAGGCRLSITPVVAIGFLEIMYCDMARALAPDTIQA